MSQKTVKVAIVGAGNIARIYAENIRNYPHVEIIGFQDALPERAAAMARQFGGRAYGSLDEVLADPDVDLVVNLTVQQAHAAIVQASLEAGKHVFSEKPMALNYEEAAALVKLADERGLRLSSAPISYMGEAQLAAWRLIRDGWAGDIRIATASVVLGQVNLWHPNPIPFLQVGAHWDVGVYALTLLTAFLGPARSVSAGRRLLKPDRKTRDGAPFHFDTPDYVLALIEFESGTVARLETSFYARSPRGGNTIEFHGDNGTIWLGDFQDFRTGVQFAAAGKDYVPVDVGAAPETIPSHGRAGRGVDEMARAILEGRPHRASAAHAAHVIEILCGIDASNGLPVEIRSRFAPPPPIELAELAPHRLEACVKNRKVL